MCVGMWLGGPTVTTVLSVASLTSPAQAELVKPASSRPRRRGSSTCKYLPGGALAPELASYLQPTQTAGGATGVLPVDGTSGCSRR